MEKKKKKTEYVQDYTKKKRRPSICCELEKDDFLLPPLPLVQQWNLHIFSNFPILKIEILELNLTQLILFFYLVSVNQKKAILCQQRAQASAQHFEILLKFKISKLN